MLGPGVDSARLLAWVRGEPCAGLPRLSSAEQATVAASWDFWARPGQLWKPSAEFITDHQAGRGFGNSRCGSESISDASKDPERWGGAAYVGGVEPLHVLNYCLQAKESGLFAVIERRERAGLGPGLRRVNLNNRVMEFEAPRGGGGGGLTVYWGASSDPKSVRGPNYGLAWLDEFGVMYHRKTDEQGTNMWDALIPAMRAGPPNSASKRAWSATSSTKGHRTACTVVTWPGCSTTCSAARSASWTVRARSPAPLR